MLFYYNKIVKEEKVSSTLRSTAQAYLNQANANKELTTPKLLQSNLRGEDCNRCLNLAQEFKTSFLIVILSEALDSMLPAKLNYGMKIHKNGAYSMRLCIIIK